jgi:hypothetical protein
LAAVLSPSITFSAAAVAAPLGDREVISPGTDFGAVIQRKAI